MRAAPTRSIKSAPADAERRDRAYIPSMRRTRDGNGMKAASFDGLAAGIGLSGKDPAAIARRVELMERLLERLFVLPGLNRPVGLDVVANAIPIVGPLLTSGLGAYIVWEARNLGLSKWQLARMGGNVGFDALLGAIPFVGAIPDFFFRSNTRNLRIIRRHLDRHHPAAAVVDGKVKR